MRTSTCGQFEIEDLLGHPPEMVEELREELSDYHPNAENRGKMVPDPKRPWFYEVQSTDFTYYIHVIPGSGKVLLLAAWPTA